MARSTFGGTDDDYVTLPTPVPIRAAGVKVTFWDAPTGGNQYTDLLDANGAAATSITSGKYGFIPEFQGPDGVSQMYGDAGGPVRLLMIDRAQGPAGPPGPGGTDADVAGYVTAGGDTTAALRRGANVARFVQRARAGENLVVSGIGDSVMEGQTVTDPATDGYMILLAQDLSSRFGVTVTQNNHGSSGYTVARAHIDGNVTAAVGDNADLYIVSFGKNDIGSDINGDYAPGYPLAASMAGLERIVRTIREDVPTADIILLAENPYTAASSSNTYLQDYNEHMRRVAAVYGCEFVDGYQPFIDKGDYSTYLNDSTHPNTAGHRLLADTLLDHLGNVDRAPIQPGAVAAKGLYSPEQIDTSQPNYGYGVNAAPGTYQGVTYTTSGAGWSSEATSTAGDYVEVTATAAELLLQISTAAADATVVDIALDGATQATDVDLSAQGKQGTYWVPFATGLTPGAHTLRLTLKSGTLRTFAAAALLTGSSSADATVTTLGDASTTDAIPSDGSFWTPVDQTISLPSGWSSAVLIVSGYFYPRVAGATTTTRLFNHQLVIDSTTTQTPQTTAPVVASGENWYGGAQSISHVQTILASTRIRFRARLISTDKTNAYSVGYKVQATLVRVA